MSDKQPLRIRHLPLWIKIMALSPILIAIALHPSVPYHTATAGMLVMGLAISAGGLQAAWNISQ